MAPSLGHRLRATLLCLLCLAVARAGGPFEPLVLRDTDPAVVYGCRHAHEDAPRKENSRLVAGALALFLGPFGAHRLYLGTTPQVAVAYGVTFGGFGLLPLLDLGHILFTKDLGTYRDNGRVFMWNAVRREDDPLTPP
jgi:hypothetical protein